MGITSDIKRGYRLNKLYNQAAHPWRYYFLDSAFSLMGKLGWLVLLFVCYVIFQYTFGNNDKPGVDARVARAAPETPLQEATLAVDTDNRLQAADSASQPGYAAIEPAAVEAAPSAAPTQSEDTSQGVASIAVQADTAPLTVAEIVGPEWLLEQPGGMYTVQIASSTAIDQLVEVTRTLGGQTDFVIYPFKNTSDGVLYGLATGSYETYKSALQNVERMPDSIRSSDPWIRSIDKLQETLRSFKGL